MNGHCVWNLIFYTYCVQEKETSRVQDSTDDMWFVDDDDDSMALNSLAVDVESDRFSVEYELDSDHTDYDYSSDSDSPFSGGVGHPCEGQLSNEKAVMEFMFGTGMRVLDGYY